MALPFAGRGRRTTTLRVRSEGAPAAFDALLLFGGRHRGETEVIAGETPFERALPEREVTVIVRPRDAARPVVVEYECAVGGAPVLRGRSWAAIPVLSCRRGSIVCAGLPGADPHTGPSGYLTNR
jgi:hypothetical protein